ncbi:hypothetical protein ACS0TY_018601 [Phlomoides rotata]
MKVVAMRESKDLSKITTFELFSDLEAYEFDIDRRKDEETSTSKVRTPVAAAAESNTIVESEDDQDKLALFIKKPGHFIKDYLYLETKKYSDDEREDMAERKKKQDKDLGHCYLNLEK